MNSYFSLSVLLAACLTIYLPSTLQSQNALNFDGTNDFVQTNFGGILGSANRTFEAWVKVNPGVTSNNAITDYGLNAVGSRNTFQVRSDYRVSYISGGTNANISAASATVPAGQWTHLAFVLNNGTGYLYMNGIQVGTGNLTTVNTPAGNANMTIGQRVSGGSIPFDGAIDEVRIWNYARSQTEIQSNMNAQFCTMPAGLVAYYQFNEGMAGGTNTGVTTLPDQSGNSYNGTLNNFALTGSSSNWVSGAPISSGASQIVLNEIACDSYTSPSGNYLWTTSGTYMDTVSSAGGCDSTFTINLTVEAVSASFSTGSSMSVCLGDSALFSDGSTGATAYNWLANAVSFSNASLATYTFTDTGTVEILLIASSSSCSDTASMSFSVSAPFASNPVITDETCTGNMNGAIDVDVVGGTAPYQYLWSNGDTTQDISQLSGGTYGLTITDSQGCSTTDSFLVNTSLGLTAAFTASSDPSLCPGETINFTNTSQLATAYEWRSDGQAFSQNMDATYTFPDSGQILIELVAIDGTCSDSTSLLFSINAAPHIDATIMGESCPDTRDGAIDLNLNGGAAPFSFLWSNAATTEDISGLDTGTYEVAILDTANCTSRDTFQVETWGGVVADFTNYPVAQGMQFSDQSLADSTITSWHWDFGTGSAADTSNEQSPVFDYGFSGTFQVCLTVEDLFGCVDSVCQFVSYTVGIDPALFQEIKLYPNPNDGHFSIDLSEVEYGQIQLEVFDALGKQVYASNLRAEPKIEMDVSHLSKGLYQLRMKSEKGYYRAKVVVE